MFVFAIVIATITVGYSLLSTTLKTTGITKIKTNWNILITDVSGVSFDGATNDKGIITDTLKADISAMINEEGGKAVYDVTVTNYGELTAVLKEIKGLEEANQGDLVYKVVGTEIGDEYLGGTKTTFQVEVTAKEGTTNFPVGPTELHLELVFGKSETGEGDMTPPDINPTIEETRTNAITINSGCTDDESGIKYYRYRINEGEWVSGSNIYTFAGLKTGEYRVQVECTNGMDLVNTSDIVTASTKELPLPSIIINPTEDIWASIKTATITYSNEQDDFVKEYSLDKGKSWQKVTDSTQTMIDFKQDGSITAKISDGINEKQTMVYEITKVDSTTPTAPIITGGSEEWTKDTRTISVVTDGTSPSGIKNYQYYAKKT